MQTGKESPWGGILRASTAVVGLSQRPFGFWGYPTNKVEMHKFYPFPGEHTDESIAHGTFYTGFGSYTMTWLALVALDEIYGSVPASTLHKVREVFDTIESQAGGYGRPVLLRAGQAIHPTARHTATALLIRIHFLPDYRPDEWLSSVKWILKSQIKEEGGWRNREPTYLEDPLRFEANALSTAVCLIALSAFLLQCEKTKRKIDQETARSIEATLIRGFQRLSTLRISLGLWRGSQSPDTDTIDSAFIMEILSTGTACAKLRHIVPEFDARILEFKDALKQSYLEKGWAVTVDDKEPSLAATICATFALTDIVGGENVRSILRGAEDYIIDQLVNHDGGQRLWSWDWVVLARLAEKKSASEHSRISEAERFGFLEKLEGIHGTNKIARLARYIRMSIPREADRAVLFLLSKGTPKQLDKLAIGIGRAAFDNRWALSKVARSLGRLALKVFSFKA